MKKTVHTRLFLRLTALLLLCSVLVSALAGCSRSVTDGAKSTEEDLRIVGKIGDYEVLYDEYRYVVLSCKSILSGKYGKDIWSTPEGIETYSPMLEEMVSERIAANYAVFILCDSNGYKNALTDKNAVKYVNAEIESTIYNLAVSAGYSVDVSEKLNGELKYKYKSGELAKARALYDELLKEYHLTERVMRLTLGAEYAFKQLSSILTTEKKEIIHRAEDIEAYLKSDNFICTRHVFIEKSDYKTYDELKAEADTVYQMFLDGASMESLIGSKYNKDTSMPYEGYYFTRGEMDKAYEDAAFALNVGEISPIVETEDGFYLIQRYEKNEEYMLTNLESFANQIVYTLVNERVRELQGNLALELSDFGRSIVLHEITAG